MKQVFINLPVQNLDESFAFYTAMGFGNNPQFSDDTAKCMVWSDNIFVMIMTHEKFNGFVTKPITDTKATIPALYSLSTESVDAMHTVADSAIAAGGKEVGELRDYGFMQQRTVEDPNGHTWEVFCMDMSKFPQPESEA